MKDRLTPEQSQRLIELGVDPSKAISSIEVPCGNMICHEKIFTLSDILSLLPKEIILQGTDIEFRIVWNGVEWVVGYDNRMSDYCHFEYSPELIDALFKMLVWCITNKHLKL